MLGVNRSVGPDTRSELDHLLKRLAQIPGVSDPFTPASSHYARSEVAPTPEVPGSTPDPLERMGVHAQKKKTLHQRPGKLPKTLKHTADDCDRVEVNIPTIKSQCR